MPPTEREYHERIAILIDQVSVSRPDQPMSVLRLGRTLALEALRGTPKVLLDDYADHFPELKRKALAKALDILETIKTK